MCSFRPSSFSALFSMPGFFFARTVQEKEFRVSSGPQELPRGAHQGQDLFARPGPQRQRSAVPFRAKPRPKHSRYELKGGILFVSDICSCAFVVTFASIRYWCKSFSTSIPHILVLFSFSTLRMFLRLHTSIPLSVSSRYLPVCTTAPSDLDEALRSAVFWAEQAEKPDASSTGKITLVFVRQGATAANGDLTLARAIAPILANNFPERLDKVFRIIFVCCHGST